MSRRKVEITRPFIKFRDWKYAWFRFSLALIGCLTLAFIYNFYSNWSDNSVPAVAGVGKPSEPSLGYCADQTNLPIIRWESFILHNCSKKSLWIIIEDRVYDMWKFLPQHPGSDAICAGAGINATKMFRKIHPSYVESAVLPRYCIGKIDRVVEDLYT